MANGRHDMRNPPWLVAPAAEEGEPQCTWQVFPDFWLTPWALQPRVPQARSTDTRLIRSLGKQSFLRVDNRASHLPAAS